MQITKLVEDGIDILFLFLLSDAEATLNRVAAFLCTHFIDQRIINPGKSADAPMNQSELEANTCSPRQARENACE